MSKATTVRIGEPHINQIQDLCNLWNSRLGGPGVDFTSAIRYLLDIGLEFEKTRLLENEYPYSAEDALALLPGVLRRSPRQPTHEELRSGMAEVGGPASESTEAGE